MSPIFKSGISLPSVRDWVATAALLASCFATAHAQVHFWGWSDNKGVTGSGKAASQVRTIDKFDKVQLATQWSVTLTPGNVPSVTIESEDNLLASIKTEVIDGTLSVFSNDFVRGKLPTKVAITYTDLTVLSIGGSGKVQLDEAKFDQLVVNQGGSVALTMNKPVGKQLVMNIGGSSSNNIVDLEAKQLILNLGGSSRVVASGTANQLSVNVGGSGSVRAADLVATDVNVSVGGSGSVRVQASKRLDASATGSGQVAYSGSPKVTRLVSGSGSIKQIGD